MSRASFSGDGFHQGQFPQRKGGYRSWAVTDATTGTVFRRTFTAWGARRVQRRWQHAIDLQRGASAYVTDGQRAFGITQVGAVHSLRSMAGLGLVGLLAFIALTLLFQVIV